MELNKTESRKGEMTCLNTLTPIWEWRAKIQAQLFKANLCSCGTIDLSLPNRLTVSPPCSGRLELSFLPALNNGEREICAIRPHTDKHMWLWGWETASFSWSAVTDTDSWIWSPKGGPPGLQLCCWCLSLYYVLGPQKNSTDLRCPVFSWHFTF